VECPARRGRGDYPSAKGQGGGVSRERGGGTLSPKFAEAPHPPLRNNFAGPPSPRVLHKRGGGGGPVNGEGQPPVSSSGARVSCLNPNTKNTVSANLLCMSDPVIVEIVGLKYSSCSPFPCDADRTCGLSECHPSGRLTKAFDALSAVLNETYGDKVDVRLTLIDDNVPDPHPRNPRKGLPAYSHDPRERQAHPGSAGSPSTGSKRDRTVPVRGTIFSRSGLRPRSQDRNRARGPPPSHPPLPFLRAGRYAGARSGAGHSPARYAR